MTRRSLLLAASAAVAAVCLTTHGPKIQAQRRFVSVVSQETGHVALGIALRKLTVSATFLETAAHPDDEHNQLFALYAHGRGFRVVDVHTTRGDGGQNEIGPELFRDISVLRTSELMAAHRLDGAEQRFARSIDFGYSFSPPEIYTKWGRAEVIGDIVRFLRQFRPDVVLTMNLQGERGGDRAHEATAVLTREAFRAAADPTQYPEHLAQGLRPWQAKKLYFTGAPGSGVIAAMDTPASRPAATVVSPDVRLATVDATAYDTLLGRTYAEIGAAARSHHKCQGMAQLLPLPGGIGGGRFPSRDVGQYELIDSVLDRPTEPETCLFAGIDTRIEALARYAGPNPPESLTTGLVAIAHAGRRAQQVFTSEGDAATVVPILEGLTAVRALRSRLGQMGLPDDARFEIGMRLDTKESDFVDALVNALGLSVEVIANDGVVVGGQPVSIGLAVANRGQTDVDVRQVSAPGFDGGFDCRPGPLPRQRVYSCTTPSKIPAGSRLTAPHWHDTYWNRPDPGPALNTLEPDVEFGLPFRPTPFRVSLRLAVGGVEFVRDVPVESRYVEDVFHGEKRMDVSVVPAFSVVATPSIVVVPAGQTTAASREIQVTVTNGNRGAASATVGLTAPPDWHVAPAAVPLTFAGEDESATVRFTVTPPAGARPGEHSLSALVKTGTTAEAFTEGYQIIDYPHIRRQHVVKTARTLVKVMDVRTTPGVRVGYVVGAGDQMPAVLEQLGAQVDELDSDDLAWGDLSKYDVIMTGVRAYEQRADLRAHNRRVLEFAAGGGIVVVQYNKTAFNQAQYGPYPANVGRGRVTDEQAPVEVLVPDHPVFRTPNTIDASTWRGWVQERGLYFLDTKDAKYVDLVRMEDSFPDNAGVRLGSLVEARVGKGRWVYVGLALWRQAPAGVPGAYQLLANLMTLGRGSAAPTR